MSIIFDNRSRIATRIRQLKTGKRYSQSPPSSLRRLVSNVEILNSGGQDDVDVSVGSNFVVYESRDRGLRLWAGRASAAIDRRRLAHGVEDGRARRQRPGPRHALLPHMTGGEDEVTSEFASVRLGIDRTGNGPRLRIEDLRTGHIGYLDALELETLAWLPEGGLHKVLDPSFLRWPNQEEQDEQDEQAARDTPHK